MSDVIRIRCSELPRLTKCLGSLGTDYVRVDTESVAAGQGTTVHSICLDGDDSIVKLGYRQDGWENQVPDGYDIDSIGYLTWVFSELWKLEATQSLFPNPETEQSLDEVKLPGYEFILTGHTDIISLYSVSGGAVADIKAGRFTDADHEAQLRGYAYMALMGMKDKTCGMDAVIFWLSDNSYQRWEWTYEELHQWAWSLALSINNWDGKTFRSGEHCIFCPRQYDCPAKQQMVKASVGQIFDFGEVGIPASPDDAIEMYSRIGEVEKALKIMIDAYTSHIHQNGVITGSGFELGLSQRNKRKLLPKALPIIRKYLSDEEIEAIITIPVSKIEKKIMETAERGLKGKLKEEFKEAIADADAIETSSYSVLTKKKIQ